MICLTPLQLLQLLLKASQDKRFVCDEAEKALETMAVSVSPLSLLKELQSYVCHANLRVRAKAAVAMSKCVSKMVCLYTVFVILCLNHRQHLICCSLSFQGIEVMRGFGLATLLQVAAELLSDRLPEAREAARTIINSIYHEFSNDSNIKDDDESAAAESWQNFCASNLPPIAAQSVAKIVSLSFICSLASTWNLSTIFPCYFAFHGLWNVCAASKLMNSSKFRRSNKHSGLFLLHSVFWSINRVLYWFFLFCSVKENSIIVYVLYIRKHFMC